MPRPLSPEEKILKKMKELLEAWDFTTAIGFPLTVRHWRNRHSKLVERPVVSIRFIDVNPNTDMGRYHNTDEECWIMGVELIVDVALPAESRSEEHTSELQSLMRISYAVFCLKKKRRKTQKTNHKNIRQQK